MVLSALREVIFGVSEFTLQDIPNFPYEKYIEQFTQYSEAERWFTGAALADQPEAKGRTDLYPLRVNPIIGTTLKHTAVLFGEVEDDARPLVVPKVKYSSKVQGQRQLAHEAEQALNNLWEENHGRAIMVQNGLMSQVYGGCVFKLTYVPWEGIDFGGRRMVPIRIERINPKNFVGTPDASDDYNLLEAWIVRTIPSIEARLWGYTGDDPAVWYVEHWLTDSYKVYVDGKPALRKLGNEDFSLGGENPFKFTPLVYIPHIRIGDFLGFNAYSHLLGMVKELNLRLGDFGDAVNDDSHPITAVRNVSGSIQLKRISEWLEVVDLGTDPGLSSAERPPDMFQVGQARASASMKDLLTSIQNQYNRDSFVPPVAYGEDEGSQRSALTLATRFWPLTSHVGLERFFWTPGLNVLDRMALQMMALKKLGGITEEHTKLRIKQKWAPTLPRDREADVNEWTARASNDIASIEHLIELAGDVEDIDEERANILKWLGDIEDIKAKVAQKYALELQEQQQKASMEMEKERAKNMPAPQNGAKKKPAGGAQ